MADTLTISVERFGDTALISAIGEVDSVTSHALHAALDDCLSRHCIYIVVDASHITFCSCQGLRALLNAAHQAAIHGGWLRLAGVTGALRRLAEVLNVTHLPMEPDVVSALGARIRDCLAQQA